MSSYLSSSSLLTIPFQPFHPSILQVSRGWVRGGVLALDGSLWVPNVQFVHVRVSAICRGGVTSLNLCFFCASEDSKGERGWGCLQLCPFLLYVVIGVVCFFVVFRAVPLTFSSLLFVSPSVSLSLSLFLSCFCSFFRTNLHACLLIISLACLHDVESQAKPLASSSHHCL